MDFDLSVTKGWKKRDILRDLEAQAQKIWAEKKTHLSEPDLSNPNKFFCTFPYPYMNGRLHLGHAYTATKAEF